MEALRRWLPGLLGLAAVLLLCRGPLHRVTHALPVSNDDAIPLLMARQVLRGEAATTLWNQPYNGTLDAYLLAPGLLVASPHRVFRAYEALCGLGLVVLAAVLAGRAFGPRAAVWTALLAAVGSPYMALMAATGPTPNFLVPLLVGAAALIGVASLDGGMGGAGRWLGVGLLCGLAVWDSALALPAAAGVGAGLVAAGLRLRLKEMIPLAVAFAAGLIPLGVARLVGSAAASRVTEVRPRWLWVDGIAGLGHAAAGLLGLDVPLVVDGPERAVLPIAAALALGLGLALAIGAGGRTRRALVFVGWAGALAAAFAFSRRTGGDEVRYLFGAVLPLLVLAGAGLARLGSWRAPVAVAVAAAIVVPWVLGGRILARHWRDPRHAARVWQVPPLDPVISTLRRAGVKSAYASLQLAGRITLESDGAVVASQAWNERIPGDPLRFRDEVDLDPRAAWVLSPHLSRGMPRAQGFRERVGSLGGAWREDVPGEFVVFRGFRPPYDETRPVPASALSVATLDGLPLPAAVLDRDVSTFWTSPLGISRGSGLVVRVAPRRRLAAVVLGLDLVHSPLGVPWIAEVDGRVVAQGPQPHGFQWVNGVPRAGKQAVLTVVLANESAQDVRITFQGPGPPLLVSEVFAYGPDESPHPEAGARAAEAALEMVRRGAWAEAAALYAEAARIEPQRAAYHGALARTRWRAAHRQNLDVESLDDGGPDLVSH